MHVVGELFTRGEIRLAQKYLETLWNIFWLRSPVRAVALMPKFRCPTMISQACGQKIGSEFSKVWMLLPKVAVSLTVPQGVLDIRVLLAAEDTRVIGFHSDGVSDFPVQHGPAPEELQGPMLVDGHRLSDLVTDVMIKKVGSLESGSQRGRLRTESPAGDGVYVRADVLVRGR